MIYLDNAATSYQKPEQVYEAVLTALKSPGNVDRGVNAASLNSSRIVFSTRCKLAQLFGISDPSRIAFTSNSTESLNMAIKGIFSEGDHVISTVLEHNSVLRPLYEIEKKGINLDFCGCDEKGNLCYDVLPELVRPNTKAIICTHGSNLTGNLVDLKKVGEFACKHNLLLIVDASQTAGVQDINVEDMNIAVLAFTGHKSLLGPQGVGGIYVRKGVPIRPFKSGGSGVRTFEKEHPSQMPTLLEAGTLNVPGIAGLGAGIDFLLENSLCKIREKEEYLMKRFYDGVKDLKEVTIYGDFSTLHRCPIVTLNIEGYDSGEISDILDQEYGIAVRSGGHCAPKMHEFFRTEKRGAVRFSFSFFNTEEEIDTAIFAIETILNE